MSKQKVEGHSGYYKDDESGVITNHSQSDREKYHIMKRQAMRNLEKEGEIDELRGELNEVKDLLRQLINKDKT